MVDRQQAGEVQGGIGELLAALISTSGLAMAARMPKVHEGIVSCTDLDLWVGDGCAEDQATGAVAAMMPMLVEIREGGRSLP